MEPTDRTQPIMQLPQGFVQRLRVIIPEGTDPLLDSAIRRKRYKLLLQQLHSHKDVRRSALAWENLAIELIHLSVRKEDQCSEHNLQLLREIAKKAEITRLYNELYESLHGNAQKIR